MQLKQRHNINFSGSGSGGRPMVFGHGFGCDQTMWRYLAPEFVLGHSLVLYDLMGSGKSRLADYDRATYASLHGHADDLLAIIRATSSVPVVFAGHSVSAMIGLLGANRAPELFAGLVMVSPSPCFIDQPGYRGGFAQADIEDLLDTMDANYLGWSSAIAPQIMGAPAQPALAQELVNSFCSTDPSIARHFARVTFLADHRADLPLCRVPTLVLQCDDDMIAPVEVGAYVQRAIPGSVLALVDNTGHCPHMSAPLRCAEAMRRFIRELR